MKKSIVVLASLMLIGTLAYCAIGDRFNSGIDDLVVDSSGNTAVKGTLAVTGQTTFTTGPVMPSVDVTASSPTVAGQIVITPTNYLVYVSTGVGKVSYWTKVGAQ